MRSHLAHSFFSVVMMRLETCIFMELGISSALCRVINISRLVDFECDIFITLDIVKISIKFSIKSAYISVLIENVVQSEHSVIPHQPMHGRVARGGDLQKVGD